MKQQFNLKIIRLFITMNHKPKLLDLFCKAGGAGMGYHRAGFDVTGVDIAPQKHYPFTFFQADAIDYVKQYGHLYDVIHASPPCQNASKSTCPAKAKGKVYPDLIPVTRETLLQFSVPSIIENVPGAIIRPDVVMRGTMFNLGVLRTRLFEINNCFVLQPGIPPKKGTVKAGDYYSVFGKGSWRKSKEDAMPKRKLHTVRESWAYALGIDWYMNETELAEAIPPAYTEYIGKSIIKYIQYQQQHYTIKAMGTILDKVYEADDQRFRKQFSEANNEQALKILKKIEHEASMAVYCLTEHEYPNITRKLKDIQLYAPELNQLANQLNELIKPFDAQ